MVSDNERREVARRLRENAEAHPNISLILNLVLADDSLKPDGSVEYRVITPHDAAMRLADLIDPIVPTDPGEAGLASVDAFIREHTEKPVDREALLKLADEMENDTWYMSSFDHRMAAKFAQRIRKLLKGES